MTSPGGMDLLRLERMARDIISHYGLPLELVVVSHDGTHWHVVVREREGRDVDLAIAEMTTAADLRAELVRRLEAAAP